MKTKFYCVLLMGTFTGISNRTDAQNANTALSNLISPTAINVTLLPDKDNKRDLGSADKSWKNVYLDGSVYLGDARFLAWQTGTGTGNTAIGAAVFNANTTGYANTATGFNAMVANTTGFYNTADGYRALYFNTEGYSNTATGHFALYGNNTGYYNTAAGEHALYYNSYGWYNTAIGRSSGGSAPGNTQCTFLGCYAGQTITSDFVNAMALGYNCNVTTSNQVRVGNGSVNSIGGHVNWTTTSDGRFKKEIKENVPGLEFINKLKPVTYHLDVAGLRKFLGEDRKENEAEEKNVSNNENMKALIEQGIKEKEKIVYTGFVAQDVEKAAKEIGYDFSGVDAAKNDKDLYGLRYAEFVVPLVKAVQELSQQNDELKKSYDAKMNDLQKQIDELKAMMVSGNQHTTMSNELPVMSDASLQQNIPNPFNHTTTINYTLPQQYSSAKIIVTDKAGKVLKEVTFTAPGRGNLIVDASMLSSGAYQYSLYIDGRVIDTKQMEHIR